MTEGSHTVLGFPREEIDLTYEGIATSNISNEFPRIIEREEIDLTYEGIATILSNVILRFFASKKLT